MLDSSQIISLLLRPALEILSVFVEAELTSDGRDQTDNREIQPSPPTRLHRMAILVSHHDPRRIVTVRLAVTKDISAEADAAVELADGMDEDAVALVDADCPGSDHDLDNKAGYVLRQLPQIHDDVDYCAHCIVMLMVSPLSCAGMR